MDIFIDSGSEWREKSGNDESTRFSPSTIWDSNIAENRKYLYSWNTPNGDVVYLTCDEHGSSNKNGLSKQLEEVKEEIFSKIRRDGMSTRSRIDSHFEDDDEDQVEPFAISPRFKDKVEAENPETIISETYRDGSILTLTKRKATDGERTRLERGGQSFSNRIGNARTQKGESNGSQRSSKRNVLKIG